MYFEVKDGKVIFKSYAHLAGLRDFDRNHWVNKELCLYLNKKVYERTEQRVVYCPDELLNISVPCATCKSKIAVDFLEKRPPCMAFYDGENVWIPGAFDILCNACGHTQMYEFEHAEYIGDIYLFGDEAMREHAGKIIISFSTIMSLPVLDLDGFKAQFLKIKEKLCPDLDPNQWNLHMTDLWKIWESGKSKQLKQFRHITEESLSQMCVSLSELLREHSNGLILYNSSGVFHRPKKFDKRIYRQFKERIYYPLLMRICQESSKTGVSPHMYFEQSGDDGWAKNLFSGGRLTGMWPVLTSGMPIPSPTFVPKGHDFRLEIADFMSFVIARYLFLINRRSLGADVILDVDPAWLGAVRYLVFTKTGYCKLLNGTKYPLHEYFDGVVGT